MNITADHTWKGRKPSRNQASINNFNATLIIIMHNYLQMCDCREAPSEVHL